MEKRKAGFKKRFAAAAVLLAAAALAAGIIIFWRSRQNIYSNDYYSIVLPEGWTVETVLEKSGAHGVHLISTEETTVAWIDIREGFEHGGKGVYSLLRSTDILGMHGSIQSERIVMSDDSKMPFYRVVVEPGLSAAEQCKGVEPYPDKLYYMYINDDNFFVCVEVRDNTLWDEMEKVVKSMRLK